jgi:hypothetical protein
MKIHNTGPAVDGFTTDRRLSYAARGLLAELLMGDYDHEVTPDELSKQARLDRGERLGEGRMALRALFRELEEYGYLERQQARGSGGQFVGSLEVYDSDPAARRIS